ncbi:ergothioneine biosynthesis protein EgtB [Aeoliella sp.]|uniref:ergothioneine biosynthesis protein EgtB n=1 Tax=Aeoliella sp. TaxID=2795800 RepID=UPI003CCBBDD3
MASSFQACAAPRATSERSLSTQYQRVRQQTDQLCAPLSPEDCVIQSMPDASPVRWHLAHTTWFFETFVLKPAVRNYQPVDPSFEYLFNSYYNQVGKQFPRPQRGLLSRPGLDQIKQYRRTVDARIGELLTAERELDDAILQTIELGLHHEQQHQELILADVKHMLSCNPLWPAYHSPRGNQNDSPAELEWIAGPEGVRSMGHHGEKFAYDNEGPLHEVLLQPHELASRLVTNGEYLEFVADGGYQRPELWLSLGWNTVGEQNWTAPLYWHQLDDQWCEFTLAGLEPLDLAAPVCHVSFFEADAYARWRECRLPTEAEWEQAATAPQVEPTGNFVESGLYHPRPARSAGGMQQLYGDVWEWTASPYTPYPGYRPPAGAIGEYNGKFMCNQYVLRGGSCATSATHIRPTYRNFFPPDARWQFSGIRLAR